MSVRRPCGAGGATGCARETIGSSALGGRAAAGPRCVPQAPQNWNEPGTSVPQFGQVRETAGVGCGGACAAKPAVGPPKPGPPAGPPPKGGGCGAPKGGGGCANGGGCADRGRRRAPEGGRGGRRAPA